MNITVEIKSVYGEDKVYPACENSRRFAEIAGTKTLTPHTIRQIKAMGIAVGIADTQSQLELMITA
jgi:hypothetical protein